MVVSELNYLGEISYTSRTIELNLKDFKVFLFDFALHCSNLAYIAISRNIYLVVDIVLWALVFSLTD